MKKKCLNVFDISDTQRRKTNLNKLFQKSLKNITYIMRTRNNELIDKIDKEYISNAARKLLEFIAK